MRRPTVRPAFTVTQIRKTAVVPCATPPRANANISVSGLLPKLRTLEDPHRDAGGRAVDLGRTPLRQRRAREGLEFEWRPEAAAGYT
jgi:hypothetical protein